MPPPRGKSGRGGGGGPLWKISKLLLLTAVPIAGVGGFLQTDPLCLLLVVSISTVFLFLELIGILKGIPFVLLPLWLLQLWILPPRGFASYEVGPPWPQEPTIAHLPSSQEAPAPAQAAPGLEKALPPAPLPAAAASPAPAAFLQRLPSIDEGAPSVFNTISVVLPCAEERELAIKTASRFCERTQEDWLAEIVVVDDGSSPPLVELFKEKEFNMERCKVKILRHEVTTGLMNAKQTGGKNAKGDVVAFFDCHVSPKAGWADEIIAKIRQNPRRMVVPAITDLNLDTFDEKENSAVNAKCYLTWDADFKWFDDESDYIPTISGGLVAMSRWWFNATGGFDDVMRGWGGENLDQSLRSWLCGGEIMRAKTSRIAHMWRTGDSRTRAHYHGRGGHVDNRARVVAAWYDVFQEKYPGRKLSKEEVQNYDPIKKALGCKPFAFFLWRFRHIYIDANVIPENVFHLRHKESDLCLTFGWNGLTAETCDKGKRQQEVQLGNQDHEEKGGKCCSGIRLFGSNDCLDYVKDGVPHRYSCDVTGSNTNQHYRWRDNGVIEKGLGDGKTCFGKPQGGLLSSKVTMGPCDATSAGQYERWGTRVPHERQLYESEVRRLGYDKLDLPDN